MHTQYQETVAPFRLPKTLPAFFWYFMRPFRWHLAGMLFAMSCVALHVSLSPYIMKIIIDRVNEYPNHEPFALLLHVTTPVLSYLGLFVIVEVISRVYDYLLLSAFPRMKTNIIKKMFFYVEQHSHSYFQKNFSGSIANKISDMAKNIESILMRLSEQFFVQALSLLFAAGTMYVVHPWFTVILLLWTFLFFLIVTILAKRSHQYATVYSHTYSHCVGNMVDSISNVLNVKLFARQEYEHHYLSRYTKEVIVKEKQLQWYMLKLKAFQGIAIAVLLAGMMGLLVYTRGKGLITVGDFALILTLALSISSGLWYLATDLVHFSQELGVCSQALSLVTVPYDIVDVEDAKPLVVTKGNITFDKVHFYYVKDQNIFENKTVTIHGGQKVGLVGSSGSGKTTFVSLILRFFDVKAGHILIDGQEIAKVTQKSLRENIAMIPQDPVLFHRSLMDNIRYGRLDATDEEVVEASRRAHCHEFIEQIEGGYQALVGERGLRLSGGQRQRIAIARAILKNAPILIFDEATSALDSVTEQKIQESLEYLMQNRTTLVIAHRLSTLSGMDRILVFDKGRIVEEGTHEELLEKNSHYAKLWNMQAGGFLIEESEEDEEY